MDYTYIKHVRGREEQSPGGFTRYENEDGRNKSDVGGSSESFLKAPRVTRQVYAETSIIPLTCFIASWANSAVPVLRFTAFVTPFFFFFVFFYFFSSSPLSFSSSFSNHPSLRHPSPLRPLLPLAARTYLARRTRVPPSAANVSWRRPYFRAPFQFLFAHHSPSYIDSTVRDGQRRALESSPMSSTTLVLARWRIPRDLRSDFDSIYRSVLSGAGTFFTLQPRPLFESRDISLFFSRVPPSPPHPSSSSSRRPNLQTKN